MRNADALLFGLAILILAAVVRSEPVTRPATQPARLVNVDKHGVAVQGYDPVAYFTQNKAVKGQPAIAATHDGAIYHFANEQHKRLFLEAPESYVPAYGGFCGYGVATDHLAPVKPECFQIVSGRLILQYNRDAMKLFSKDLERSVAAADANWPNLVAEHGRR